MTPMLSKNWWAFAVRGGLSMVFALLAVAWSGASPNALAKIFGVFALAEGALSLLATANLEALERPWPLTIEGVLGLSFGLVGLSAPFSMLSSVAWLIASWIATVGVLEGATALRVPGHVATPRLFAAIGVGSLVSAFAVVIAPWAGWAGEIVTVWFVGAWAAFLGALTFVIAMVLRHDTLPRITPFEWYARPASISRPSHPSHHSR